MFYMLEFFSLEDGGDKKKLKAMRRQAQSADHAVSYAKAVLKHVVIQDKSPDLCLVKYQNGKVPSVAPKP